MVASKFLERCELSLCFLATPNAAPEVETFAMMVEREAAAKRVRPAWDKGFGLPKQLLDGTVREAKKSTAAWRGP